MTPNKLKLAVAQARTLETTAETLKTLEATTKRAAQQGARLVLFPEAYLGGYPRTCNFGASIGGRQPEGREQFLHYFRDAVDLGDTPRGAGDDWVERRLPRAKGSEFRGDGVREELERIARETDTFIVTGLVERSGGTLYCAVVYIDPHQGTLGKRRKVMPTGSERLIWGQGSASTLRAVSTTIDGVRLTMAAAICWENYMPLLRQSLYAQNVNLYFAPTADARPTWLPLMITAAFESRAFVLSSNQCQKRSQLPTWIQSSTSSEQSTSAAPHTDGPTRLRRSSTLSKTPEDHEISWPSQDFNLTNGSNTGTGALARPRRKSVITPTPERHEICWPAEDGHFKEAPELNGAKVEPSQKSNSSTAAIRPSTSLENDEYVSRGGSCIISPLGEVKAGPIWETPDDELLVVDADFDDCDRGRLDLDVAGSYSRNDAFKLTVEGLDLNPPP